MQIGFNGLDYPFAKRLNPARAVEHQEQRINTEKKGESERGSDSGSTRLRNHIVLCSMCIVFKYNENVSKPKY